MTNAEKLKQLSLAELLARIRFENSVCPIKAFCPEEKKSDEVSKRCKKYGFYTMYSVTDIAEGSCIRCITDFLSEEVIS